MSIGILSVPYDTELSYVCLNSTSVRSHEAKYLFTQSLLFCWYILHIILDWAKAGGRVSSNEEPERRARWLCQSVSTCGEKPIVFLPAPSAGEKHYFHSVTSLCGYDLGVHIIVIWFSMCLQLTCMRELCFFVFCFGIGDSLAALAGSCRADSNQ